jgi:hypothetical protein
MPASRGLGESDGFTIGFNNDLPFDKRLFPGVLLMGPAVVVQL